MKAYTAYKPSGVEWIGEIPKDWKLKRLKDLADTVLGKMLQNTDKGEDELKPYLRSLNVQWENVTLDDVKEMWLSEYERQVYRLRMNDIVVSEGGEIGRAALWQEQLDECYIQNSVYKITAKSNVNPSFLLYQFVIAGGMGHFDKIVNRVSIAHLVREKIVAVQFASPSIEEQTAIATYLDDKTAKLDELISNKETQIERLKELRQIEITHAVTKGLNPKAPLKASGVEWLGDIPKYWEVKRFKDLTTRIGDGIHSTPNYVANSEYHFVNGNNLIEKRIKITDNTNCVSEEEFNLYDLQLALDTILLSINGTIGNLGFYKGEKVVFGKSIAFIQCFDTLNENYIHYFLQSNYVQTVFELSFAGTTIKNLSLNTIRNTKIALPSTIEEQTEIADYLDDRTTKIDQLIQNITTQIDQLKEVRKIEIYNAVTGKVKVA